MRPSKLWELSCACCIGLLETGAAAAEGGKSAFTADMAYTGEVFSNVRGGLDTGTRYLDNLDVSVGVDLEDALNIPGTSFYASGLYNNDNSLSAELVGDAQVVSSIDATNAWRLYEAWVEHHWARGRTSVKAGLYDLNSEFDVNETGGLFVNSSHGTGAELGQTGANGPSIFPVTGLAARLQWRPVKKVWFRGAVLEATPGDPDRPRNTVIDFDDHEGVLSIFEGEWAPSEKLRMIAGYWRYSRAFDHLVYTDSDSDPLQTDGNDGAYALIEGTLFAHHGAPDRGLAGFVRAGFAEEDINPFSAYLGAGLVYTGAFSTRPDDQAGLAVAVARNGDASLEALRRAGVTPARNETNAELTYRFALADWLSVQPDVQYIVNPGTDQSVDDAFVIGFRFEVAPLALQSLWRR